VPRRKKFAQILLTKIFPSAVKNLPREKISLPAVKNST